MKEMWWENRDFYVIFEDGEYVKYVNAYLTDMKVDEVEVDKNDPTKIVTSITKPCVKL